MRLSHVVCRESNSALVFQREKGNMVHGLQNSLTRWWWKAAYIELLVPQNNRSSAVAADVNNLTAVHNIHLIQCPWCEWVTEWHPGTHGYDRGWDTLLCEVRAATKETSYIFRQWALVCTSGAQTTLYTTQPDGSTPIDYIKVLRTSRTTKWAKKQSWSSAWILRLPFVWMMCVCVWVRTAPWSEVLMISWQLLLLNKLPQSTHTAICFNSTDVTYM